VQKRFVNQSTETALGGLLYLITKRNNLLMSFIIVCGPVLSLLCIDCLGQEQLSIPNKKYEVRLEKKRMVPMRDGVRLATDLYFPENPGKQFPVILIRTPYDKTEFREVDSPAYLFASHGYVVAVQDVRGKFESEGDYIVSAADTKDGYDMISWAARQPWSSGKVGTYGCSYLGENQIETAKLRNPNHYAMIPQAAGGAHRYFGALTGGAFELAAGFGWFLQHGKKVHAPSMADSSPVNVDFRGNWRSLPLIDMLRKAGGPPTDFEGFVSHAPGDTWWNQFGYVKDTDRFDVPALHVNSWYDFGVADTLKLFNLFRRNSGSARARDKQFVIISPTTHCRSEQASQHTKVGERDLGDARFDYNNLYLRWFDYTLKGIANAMDKIPHVQLYVMGRNEWRDEHEWPLARTNYTKYYLRSNGHANSRFGTGILRTLKPKAGPSDHYVYDPENPVPSVGGPVCCTGTPDAPPGAFDQTEVESRNDVLVYTTDVLKKGIEVTGPLEAVLYVSSSARDTDFTLKLVDVYPDGRAYNIQETILRSRYRQGFDKKVWMTQGKVYKLDIDLNVTSNYFAPGHRIRLEISSSNFPRFDRNLNTGGNNYDETKWVTAKNTIHHSRLYPSHITLPIIP